MTEIPLFSIVTPCLNRVDYIEEAIQSVIAQNFESMEHIIVDGGSTDGTLDVIKRYPHIRLVVKSDRSLYEALNTGISESRGEIVGWLNTDDLYEKGAFAPVADLFARDPGIDIVSGCASIFVDGPLGQRTTIRQFVRPHQIAPTLFQFVSSEPIINARFIRKRVYARLGLYESHYRLSGDRDWALRLVLSHPKNAHYSGVVYHYRKHDGSLSMSNTQLHWEQPIIEDIEIAAQYSRSPNVDFWARLLLRIWLTKIAWRGVREAARHKIYKRFWHYMGIVAKYAPFCPPALLLFIFSKMDRVENV